MNSINFNPNFAFNAKAKKQETKEEAGQKEAPKQSYELPNYQLSFGMAKIKKCKNFPEFALEEGEARNVRWYAETISRKTTKESDYEEITKKALDYCSENDNRLQYFLNEGIRNTSYPQNFVRNYIGSVETKYKVKEGEEQTQKQKDEKRHLIEKLIHTQGPYRGTPAEEYSNNLTMMQILFKATDDYPDMQYEILTKETDCGGPISERYKEDTDEIKGLKKLFNAVIFHLAARTEGTVEDAISLLERNDTILDEKNRALLDTFKAGDYEIEEEESEENQ